MIYPVVLTDTAESVRDASGFEYCLASSSGWKKSPVLWVEIGESSLTRLELVQETSDKGVAIEGRNAFWKEGLRLPEELSCVDDIFDVSNKKNVLADISLHVPLDEIKVDKTLCFLKEPVENSDREVKRLKCCRIVVVEIHFGSKQGL
ncbi:hypothetical protein Tco_1243599 [Tanacetum coccineum]